MGFRHHCSGSASHATAPSAPQPPRNTPTAAVASAARHPPKTEPSRRATSARSADRTGCRAGSPPPPRVSSRAAERLLASAIRVSCGVCVITSATLKPRPSAVSSRLPCGRESSRPSGAGSLPCRARGPRSLYFALFCGCPHHLTPQAVSLTGGCAGATKLRGSAPPPCGGSSRPSRGP